MARFHQRCAIRLTYASNRMPGQWCAHGRYLMRDSAAEGEPAFNAKEEQIDAGQTLRDWQSAGDTRVFKIIVSPEFGDRLDLKSVTRKLMRAMQQDLGALEWIAVAHYNTAHAHAHIALRGVCEGKELRIPRQYVQSGIRARAQDLCTRELGYRTAQDALDAQKKEAREPRFTSLDRIIESQRPENSGPAFLFTAKPGLGPTHPVRDRLKCLREMELAEDLGGGQWSVRSNFASILKAMQRAADRQRMLADSGGLLSDRRLSLKVTESHNLISVEGRVLTHGLDDETGRSFMLLESTQGQVHYIPHDNAIEKARHRGLLRPNAFIEIHCHATGRITVNDLGDAEALLKNKSYLASKARQLLLRGITPDPPTWGGWLGRYQSALQKRPTEPQLDPSQRVLERS